MTIHDYTEQAVRKYLRTVLLVDDRLFVSESGTVPEQTSVQSLGLVGAPDTSASSVSNSGREPRSPGQSQAGSGHPSGDGSSQSTDSFSAQAVIDGFSQLGIVCGLYQPNTSEFSDGSIPQKLIDLCNHSDVFILDWKLKSGQADSPVPALLSKLIKGDESIGAPMAIRFCAIYTDQFLNTVFAELRTAIKEGFPEKSVVEEIAKFRIRVDGITIRLYRKNDLPEADGTPTRFVSSHDLSEKIEKDFVSEYEGIMSANALCGIAKVRDNSKRILEKFPPALDYALMVHGGLTVKAPTTSEDLQELLSDEIYSILSEPSLTDNELYGMFYEKADKVSSDKFRNIFPPAILKNGVANPEDIKRYFCNIFKRNDPSVPSPFIGCNSEATTDDETPSIAFLNRLLRLVKKVAESRKYSEGDLSQLFCYRTIYGNTRVLKSGTIVREKGTQRRYVCLMPPCDCIRLGQDVVEFPFWELTPVDANHKGHAHGVVITDESGRSKTICVKGKIHKKMRFWKFRADNEVSFVLQRGRYILSEETSAEVKTQFEWVAELKPLHAQRIAEYVSRQFSRVGLAESEWLRLQVDR